MRPRAHTYTNREALSQNDPMEIKIWVEPTRDLLAAYERIVSAPQCAWHGEDSHSFPMSSWERPEGEDTHFLVPGIESATVTCEHWSTPERLSRSGGRLPSK